MSLTESAPDVVLYNNPGGRFTWAGVSLSGQCLETCRFCSTQAGARLFLVSLDEQELRLLLIHLKNHRQRALVKYFKRDPQSSRTRTPWMTASESIDGPGELVATAIWKRETLLQMDAILSLGAPLKQFTSTCAPGKGGPAPKGAKGRRSSFTRRRSISRRRSLPCGGQKVPDSHWLRVYQAEVKRERKRQQAVLAKKNAERCVRKTHFRSHHCLPRQTATTRKHAAKKEDSLFGAFQGLSLDGVMGGVNGSAAAAATAAGGDQCSVM